MTINAEEIEARLREAIAPFIGTRVTKENLAKALNRVATQIVREQAPPSEIKVTSMDANGKIAFELPPDLSRAIREKLGEEEPRREVCIALGPDGEILYNPPEQSLAND